jgi:hypothetical protein
LRNAHDYRNVAEAPEPPWDDMTTLLALLMKIDATLERIERSMTEDDDGEEDADA